MNDKKIIVIEGASDGIGKSTQFKLLKKYLENNGKTVISHHFPSYNTLQGKLLEEYLAGNLGNITDLSPYLINSLYAIDRALTWEMSLKKEIEEENKLLLLDRYTTSSLIYQSAVIEDLEERKKFIDYVMDYEYNKLGIPIPDSVIFLKAPYDVIKKLRDERKENDGIKNDIHEANDIFLRKVYENAIFISNYLNWIEIECSINGEMLPIEEIHKKIIKILK